MIRLALHGGAGDPAAGHDDDGRHRAELRRIAEAGFAALRNGRAALDVVELVVVLLEECPLFNAGVGAVLNRDGLPELDAAIMDGGSRACGSVAGVTRARSPVHLARAVMEKTPHVMLAGAGADRLNRELGLAEVRSEHFVTEKRLLQWKEAQRKNAITLDQDGAFGTVGCVARDVDGHLAAATSTGGLSNKHPGRVGDSPLIGAGTWADDRSLAVSCTGSGESFIRTCFAHQLHARLLYAGETLAQACAAALADLGTQGGRGGCIAIDRMGRMAMPFNSGAMYRAWAGEDGIVNAAAAPRYAPSRGA